MCYLPLAESTNTEATAEVFQNNSSLIIFQYFSKTNKTTIATSGLQIIHPLICTLHQFNTHRLKLDFSGSFGVWCCWQSYSAACIFLTQQGIKTNAPPSAHSKPNPTTKRSDYVSQKQLLIKYTKKLLW